MATKDGYWESYCEEEIKGLPETSTWLISEKVDPFMLVRNFVVIAPFQVWFYTANPSGQLILMRIFSVAWDGILLWRYSYWDYNDWLCRYALIESPSWFSRRATGIWPLSKSFVLIDWIKRITYSLWDLHRSLCFLLVTTSNSMHDYLHVSKVSGVFFWRHHRQSDAPSVSWKREHVSQLLVVRFPKNQVLAYKCTFADGADSPVGLSCIPDKMTLGHSEPFPGIFFKNSSIRFFHCNHSDKPQKHFEGL
jgi:hypothetical protein